MAPAKGHGPERGGTSLLVAGICGKPAGSGGTELSSSVKVTVTYRFVPAVNLTWKPPRRGEDVEPDRVDVDAQGVVRAFEASRSHLWRWRWSERRRG